MSLPKRNNLVSFLKNLATTFVAGFFVCVIFSGFFGFTQNIQAQETSSESIKNFKTTLVVNTDSSVSVRETILYDFGPNERHGIFRDIPITKVVGAVRYLDITDIAVTDETGKPYTTDISGGGVINIRIGDPDVYVTGTHSYVISYTLKNVIGYFDTYDELYWNVTGNEWQIPIESAEAEIILPDWITEKDLQTSCYRGVSGSNEECPIVTDITSSTTSIPVAKAIRFSSGRPLAPYEGLTVALGFPKNTVAPVVIMWWEKSSTYYISAIVIFFLFAGFFLKWFLGIYLPERRNNRKAIIAQYDPPGGITAGQAGEIYKWVFPVNKIIGADILYLASCGFLSISLIEDKKFAFTRLKEIPADSNEPTYLSDLLSLVTYAERKPKSIEEIKSEEHYYQFAHIQSVVALSARDISEGSLVGSLKPKNIRKDLTQRKINFIPIVFFSFFVIFFIFPAFFLFKVAVLFDILPASSMIFLGMFLGCIVAYIAAKKILITTHRKKTPFWYEVAGLYEYINVAEKHRLSFENDPEKSLEIYSTLFPFAVAFGLENKWTKVFEGIIPSPPTWFESSSSMNSLSGFSASLGGMSSSLGGAVNAGAPVSSSSGGSSGGGSSGGGGGGGGGGSW